MTQAIRLDPTSAFGGTQNRAAQGAPTSSRAAAKRHDPTAPRGPYA